jgi:hypothetical protein
MGPTDTTEDEAQGTHIAQATSFIGKWGWS